MDIGSEIGLKMKSKRIDYLDIARLFACVLIITTHSAYASENPSYKIWLSLLNVIGTPGTDLFFVISGSLLFPVMLPNKLFIKKKITKILLPLLFWSLFFLFKAYITDEMDTTQIVQSLIKMPFKPIVGVYWFLYVICGLYLFAPIISKWLVQASKPEFKYYLGLWTITLILPYMNFFFPDFFDLSGSYYDMFNLFGGFLGCMILGYYLYKYPVVFRSKLQCGFILSGLFLLTLIPIFLCGKYAPEFRSLILSNLQIICVVQVFVLFTFFQNFTITNVRILNIIRDMSQCSFGIYLIHIYIIQYMWRLVGQGLRHPLIEVPIVIFLIFLVSYVLVKLISFIPYSNYIVGFSSVKRDRAKVKG